MKHDGFVEVSSECCFFSCGKGKKTIPSNNKVQKSLESGFKDVREIIDEKQKRITIDEFINELRNNPNRNF